jgi:hypothetical protein
MSKLIKPGKTVKIPGIDSSWGVILASLQNHHGHQAHAYEVQLAADGPTVKLSHDDIVVPVVINEMMVHGIIATAVQFGTKWAWGFGKFSFTGLFDDHVHDLVVGTGSAFYLMLVHNLAFPHVTLVQADNQDEAVEAYANSSVGVSQIGLDHEDVDENENRDDISYNNDGQPISLDNLTIQTVTDIQLHIIPATTR